MRLSYTKAWNFRYTSKGRCTFWLEKSYVTTPLDSKILMSSSMWKFYFFSDNCFQLTPDLVFSSNPVHFNKFLFGTIRFLSQSSPEAVIRGAL